ncbi:MAG: isoprenylcysteine carboxylmethyltransferase family protein [Chloroflexi bacterium]|nr:isoprenylcysteine carboxylmethyltransferase family protein [Chloroflexota bacterium]
MKPSIKPTLIIRAALYLFLPFAILIGVSGKPDWLMGWLYVGLALAASLAGRALVARKNPDMLAERAASLGKEDAKPWDRVLVVIVAVVGPWVMMLVAGLDVRFGWTPPPSLAWQVVGLAGVLLGYLLSIWAFVENRFFSAVVRIQKERGHTVVSAGPYRLVRHPGYLGGLLSNLAAPLMLGAFWTWIPVALLGAGFIVRTTLEDRTLQDELEGYRAYATKVRYRLFPGIW